MMTRNPRLLLSAAVLPLLATSLLSGCGSETPADSGATQQSTSAPANLGPTVSPPGAAVFIIAPTNGAVTAAPITVKFGVSGMGIAPSGTYNPNTGHHHLLIDTPLPSPDLPIAKDAQHVHFGKGQTETVLELEPGEHTLQLLLGDGNHVPHQPPVVSQVVTITVE
jgi:hypothetical protein